MTTPDPTRIAALNDLSFQLAKESKWAESVEAAREALVLDEESSAAWFNLGKAQLGAGAAGEAVASFQKASELTARVNVDVEYNLTKALLLSGQTEKALVQAKAGAKNFPSDPDFPKLLVEVLAAGSKRWAEIDLDGDGEAESFWETKTGLMVTTNSGTVLHESQIGSQINSVSPRTMPDGTVLAHVIWAACPSYPQNELLWYNPETKRIQDAIDKDMCTPYDWVGVDSFSSVYRQYPLAAIVTRQWQKGALVDTSTRWVLFGTPHEEQIPWILTRIASESGEIEGAPSLFATEALYQEFQSLTDGGSWTFERVSPEEPLRLTVAHEGKILGSITLQQSRPPGTKITAFTWPPVP